MAVISYCCIAQLG